MTSAAAWFPEPPVLVATPLGGLVVQRYLERHPARGAVLLAPLPHRWILGAVARLTVRHPLVMARAHLTPRLRPSPAAPA